MLDCPTPLYFYSTTAYKEFWVCDGLACRHLCCQPMTFVFTTESKQAPIHSKQQSARVYNLWLRSHASQGLTHCHATPLYPEGDPTFMDLGIQRNGPHVDQKGMSMHAAYKTWSSCPSGVAVATESSCQHLVSVLHTPAEPPLWCAQAYL